MSFMKQAWFGLWLYLGVELVITEVQRGVDGFERLKVNVDFLLFAFFCHYGAAVNHQTVMGHCKHTPKQDETPAVYLLKSDDQL